METYEEIRIMEKEGANIVYELIAKYKPKTYCEIGLHNGLTAAGVVKEMLKYHDDVYIEGYDAFQEVTRVEHNGKSMSGDTHYNTCVKRFEGIKRSKPRFTYKIIKGLTSDTLKPKKFDLAYIDGGHSYETTLFDYNMLKESKIIVFDDYNLPGVMKAVDEIGLGEEMILNVRKKRKWLIINK